MTEELTESSTSDSSSPTRNPSLSLESSQGQIRDDNSQSDRERLERVEAAIELLLDHLHTSTKSSEILEAEHSRNLLSSIALGFSSISLIALWSIDLARDDVEVNLIRFTIGMALLLFASVIDLSTAPLLRKAVNRAILEQDPSRLVIWGDSKHRWFQRDYWLEIKRLSPDFYNHQVARCSALVIYVLAGAFLIWAVFTI